MILYGLNPQQMIPTAQALRQKGKAALHYRYELRKLMESSSLERFYSSIGEDDTLV